jgi:hypothetical protein
MPDPTASDLQRLAREVFGRDLSPEDAWAYRERLPAMARAVRVLEAWEERLAGVEPAAVHRVPADEEDGRGGAG